MRADVAADRRAGRAPPCRRRTTSYTDLSGERWSGLQEFFEPPARAAEPRRARRWLRVLAPVAALVVLALVVGIVAVERRAAAVGLEQLVGRGGAHRRRRRRSPPDRRSSAVGAAAPRARPRSARRRSSTASPSSCWPRAPSGDRRPPALRRAADLQGRRARRGASSRSTASPPTRAGCTCSCSTPLATAGAQSRCARARSRRSARTDGRRRASPGKPLDRRVHLRRRADHGARARRRHRPGQRHPAAPLTGGRAGRRPRV